MPSVRYFKPQGIPIRKLDETTLRPDELEAMRLHDAEGNDQNDSAQKMGISQPTFARIISSARKKTAQALIRGNAIRIEQEA